MQNNVKIMFKNLTGNQVKAHIYKDEHVVLKSSNGMQQVQCVGYAHIQKVPFKAKYSFGLWNHYIILILYKCRYIQ